MTFYLITSEYMYHLYLGNFSYTIKWGLLNKSKDVE